MEIVKPTVDVAIICYNEFDGLKETVESVLSQSYVINTVLLSDDGSGKRFPSEITKLFDGAPCQLIVRHGEKNLGTVAHMNAAATLLSSMYIKFLSPSDTFSDCDALKSLVEFAWEKQAEVVSSQCVICNRENYEQYFRYPDALRLRVLRKTGNSLFTFLSIKNGISMVGSLFSRSFFNHMGFDESYKYLEDWPTWLKLARNGSDIPVLPRVTTFYPLGGASSKDGNAYHSQLLHADMCLCYEKEILPYYDRFPRIARKIISYRYACLSNVNGEKLLRKFPALYLIDVLERKVKKLLTKS